ncbi:hypothetical protein B0H14DRAFT_3860036 [Mycena olivaceomarginata]|nr:hypothetical protein B0H14DRAFT_3860036 [Mycena olivaceomarginata]
MQFFALHSTVLAAIGLMSVATAIPNSVSLLGDSNPLVRRDTTVTYCGTVSSSGCESNTCQTYTGAPTCLRTPNVACAIANSNVLFCRGVACDGDCTPFIPCRLQGLNGVCVVPQTQSILVLS